MTNPNDPSNTNKNSGQDPRQPPPPPPPPQPQGGGVDLAGSSTTNVAPAPANTTPPSTSPPPPPPPLPPAAPAPAPARQPAALNAPPPFAGDQGALAVVGGGIEVGGGGGGSLGTRLALPEHPRPSQKRKPAEVVAPEGLRPACSVCGRSFGSWKAMFGHMRSHPDRQWRGAFPPPVFSAHAAGEQPSQGGEASSVAGGRLPLDFDLNQPQEGAPGNPTQKEKDGSGGSLFDLNKPPAKDDSE